MSIESDNEVPDLVDSDDDIVMNEEDEEIISLNTNYIKFYSKPKDDKERMERQRLFFEKRIERIAVSGEIHNFNLENFYIPKINYFTVNVDSELIEELETSGG